MSEQYEKNCLVFNTAFMGLKFLRLCIIYLNKHLYIKA